MAGGKPDRATEGIAETHRVPVGRARSLFHRAFSGRDTSDAGEFKESGIGRLLCATRMRLGKDLQHIGQVLHIRYTYLVAIEDGRYEDLPGQAYAIGFVRAYADHLGLDGDEVVRRFKEESSGLRRKAALDFPIPTPDSGIPSGLSLLAAVLLGMAVYGTWFAVSSPSRKFALVQEVPTRLTAAQVAAAPPPDQAPSEQTEDAAGNIPQATTSDLEIPPAPTVAADVQSVTSPTPPPASKTVSASQPASPSTPPVEAAAEVSSDVLEVRAKVDSWIQIRKGETLLFTKLLRKGDVYRVPERGLTLMTGNAGGVEVLLNGEVMPPLGDAGAVASGIPLEPAHFKAGD